MQLDVDIDGLKRGNGRASCYNPVMVSEVDFLELLLEHGRQNSAQEVVYKCPFILDPCEMGTSTV